MSETLVPVGDVADRFALAVSTLHYWERRGLITPHRRAGRRYYDAEHLYRIALIRIWRDTGLMSLDEIAAVFAGRTATHNWRDTVESRISAIEAQMEQLDTARGSHSGGQLRRPEPRHLPTPWRQDSGPHTASDSRVRTRS
ncbi:MerR family transcriptional regulator (plasmid) [Embleya sp. NBC_00888]|uniref:helix-turn-helix domain-containing protein n=1 Tax=Embleya sp. NBC_00888 TaxID=2975960 RepID=UPI002F9073D5|nr:MerR family transcriptional regulator [Embleya sp. NBC_00888]